MTTDPYEDAPPSDTAANEFAGKVKREWGDMTDDERVEAEGARQELEAETDEPADREAREDAERNRRSTNGPMGW
ncbi:MAG: CsbD family protein [Tessaracoccus sp.]|uniref:CsbD family protein n=1 Tax=Tessaracoccus sp. TaxID=1971211 RepID=UPI001EBBDEE8|nr:CsbD family protein [Tessaracoccus sp.]MBK7821997.1 CsbD family protein [Tessaracoccus sp.]